MHIAKVIDTGSTIPELFATHVTTPFYVFFSCL